MTSVGPRDSEWLTRKCLIDPKLKAAGWQVIRSSDGKSLYAYDHCAIEEFPTENGPADYVLCVSGKILGIVEAKKLTLAPQNVLTQAERYSKGATSNPLNYRGYRVPFLYSTNGEIIWHRVEALFKLSGAIEKRLAAATVRAEKLTQAILSKAFRGELVPTEAELARREGRSYEPASVLLDRIRTPQAAPTASKAPSHGVRRGRRKRA